MSCRCPQKELGVIPPEAELTDRQIDVDEAAEDVDHLISPEELLRVAMAKQ